MSQGNSHRTKLDKTNVSNVMEFGNEVKSKTGWIHNSDNSNIATTVISVIPKSKNGKKYGIIISGDYLNDPIYDSKVIQNGTEGIIYYSDSNINLTRPFVLFRISSTPTTDTVNTTFDINIIDHQKEIIDVFGKQRSLGIPHVGDTISWPLLFQNIYNNSTVINKISVSSNGTNSIKFKWEDYSNSSVFYKIHYRELGKDITTNTWVETPLINSVSGIYQEYIATGLNIGIKYEWSVMSYYSEDLKQFSLYFKPEGQFTYS